MESSTMSWLTILSVAVLTAISSALLGAVVASLGVDWYHVSSFEGKSGFLVVFIILACLVGGLLLGGATAGVVAAGAAPGFGKALGISLLIVLLAAGAAAAILRALADVPPTLGGEKLMLMVEVRWPAAQTTTPAKDAELRTLELDILSGNVQRLSRQGPLWMEDARNEDGRWIVPGAVELFTNRGTRVIQVQPAIPGANGLLLPMDGTPGPRDLDWSAWLPRVDPAGGSVDDGFTYRFKVMPRSHASRSETIDAFQVDTIADSFFLEAPGARPAVMTARAEFVIHYRGQPISFDAPGDAGNRTDAQVGQQSSASPRQTRVQAVATLPGLPTALLVRVEMQGQPATCRLLTDAESRVLISVVASCDYLLTALPITTDTAWREAATVFRPISGRIDRETFMHPGIYLFNDALFDTDRRIVRRIDQAAFSNGFNSPSNVSPLGMSPDGLSIVRVGEAWTPDRMPALQDFDTETNTSHLLVIDRVATRFAGSDAVDNEWLQHYYEWQRAGHGHDRLVARAKVTPLPYQGVVHTEDSGDLVYRVQPAGTAMCDRLAEFLVSDFAAERAVKAEYGESYSATVQGIRVTVFVNASDHQVALFLDSGGDMSLVRRIAEAFNAQLATGRYDELFEQVQ
jgi:hypothetical protein